jgi:hypothetical protein
MLLTFVTGACGLCSVHPAADEEGALGAGVGVVVAGVVAVGVVAAGVVCVGVVGVGCAGAADVVTVADATPIHSFPILASRFTVYFVEGDPFVKS